MYPFYPNFGYRQVRVPRLDYAGIPVLRTVSVTTDTTNSEVIYNVNPCQFRSLPNEGIILLNIQHVPATGSETFPVSIATRPSGSTTTTTSTTSSSKIPLINGSGEQMVSNEISQGNRYFIYYNKCEGIFQTVNHIVSPTATPTQGSAEVSKVSK
jgi:hypothetical protein